MVWHKWKAPVVLALLACAGLTGAGLVFSQQAAPRPAASGDNAPDIITMHEDGKPPQKYAVVKEYKAANGQRAQDLRNLSTGEVSTVYFGEMPPNTTPPSPAPAKTMAPPVEKAKTSPPPKVQDFAGERIVPQPVQGTKGQPLPSATQSVPVTTTVQYRTIEEPGKPAAKARVMVEWRTPDGRKASQLQAVDSGEMFTIVESGPSGEKNKTPAQLYHWGKSKTPPPGVPTPPATTVVTPMPSQPQQKIVSSETVMPPPRAQIITEQPKSNLWDKVKNTFGNILGSEPAPQMMPMPPPQRTAPKVSTSTMIVEPVTTTSAPVTTAKNSDAAKHTTTVPVKTLEAVATADVAKPAESSKGAASVKSAVAATPVVAPKPLEATSVIDLPSAKEPIKPASESAKTQVGPKVPDVAKATSGPTFPDLPKGPSLPPPPNTKELPASIPSVASGTSNSKEQWSSPPKTSPVGKPSADTTLAQSFNPTLPAPQPKAAPTTATAPLPTPPVAPAPTPATPPTTAQLASASVLPSLPPSSSMPVSQSNTARKSDPLAAPDLFSSRVEAQPVKEINKAPNPGTAHVGDGPRLPLGSGSVAAATNPADPRWLPGQMVAGPQAMPPQVPAYLPATVPAPTMAGNAFTSPPSPEAQQQALAMQQQMAVQQQQMAMMQQQQMMAMMQQNQGMPPAYPQMMPQGYAQMPMVYPMAMPSYPAPNMQAYGVPVMPQNFAMAAQPVQPMAYANPSMDRPGMPVSGPSSTQQCISTLQSSIYPSQRELVVMQLSTVDWRTNPQVVQVLMTSAKDDPAALVRAACVSGLSRMGVTTDAALATFQHLKSDADPRVRQEADHALSRLAGMQQVGR